MSWEESSTAERRWEGHGFCLLHVRQMEGAEEDGRIDERHWHTRGAHQSLAHREGALEEG